MSSSSASVVSLIIIMQAAIAFLVLVRVHACSATSRHSRPFRFLSFTKLQDDAEIKTHLGQHHQVYINNIIDGSTSSEEDDKSIATLDKNTGLIMEMEGLKGKARSGSRSMLQSSHNEAKEEEEEEVSMTNTANTNDEGEGEPVEDTVVMDYVQIHRKSPIHNHH